MDLFCAVQFFRAHFLTFPDANLAPSVIEHLIIILRTIGRFCFIDHIGHFLEAVIERGGILHPPFSYCAKVVRRQCAGFVKDIMNGCSPYHIFVAGLAGALTRVAGFNIEKRLYECSYGLYCISHKRVRLPG
jgi:hypothetical protein